MKLAKDFKEFIRLLNAHGVRYVVVGGYAVAYHGYPRLTGDMDFFVEASEENALKIEQVLRAFGFADTSLTAADFVKQDMVVQLGMAPNRIDIVTGIESVAFADAWDSRTAADMGGVMVNVIGLEMLLKNKNATGRPQDTADVRHLIGEGEGDS